MDGHNNDKKGHKDDLQKSYANPITFCLSTTILYNLVICI